MSLDAGQASSTTAQVALHPKLRRLAQEPQNPKALHHKPEREQEPPTIKLSPFRAVKPNNLIIEEARTRADLRSSASSKETLFSAGVFQGQAQLAFRRTRTLASTSYAPCRRLTCLPLELVLPPHRVAKTHLPKPLAPQTLTPQLPPRPSTPNPASSRLTRHFFRAAARGLRPVLERN